MEVNVVIVINNGTTISAYSDASSSPSTVVSQFSSATNGLVFTFSFMVLNGNYYEISTGSSAISKWTEWS